MDTNIKFQEQRLHQIKEEISGSKSGN
jgi:hypothetical protein